ELPELRPDAESFDHVLANPPYNQQGAGTVSIEALKTAANVMPGGNLARWARFIAAMARPGGSATMIHRADAIGEVLSAFAGRFAGPIGMVTPLRPGLALASVAGPIERAFSFSKLPTVAIVVNSPGGSPVQSHLIFRRIRQLAAEKGKRVYVFCEDVAASGGYF